MYTYLNYLALLQLVLYKVSWYIQSKC